LNPEIKLKENKVMQMRKKFLLVLVLAMVLLQSSFAQTQQLLTPREVWKDFDPDKGDFKEEIITQENNKGIFYRESYISAYVSGQEIRVYCKYSVKEGIKKAPGLMDVHGWMSYPRISQDYVDDGWAVMAHDYCGRTGNRKHYTKYPEKLRYGNMDSDVGYRIKSVLPDGQYINDPRQTDDYLWYAIQRRVLSYLLAQKEVDKDRIGAKGYSYGGTLMWNLAMDSRVKAIVAYFGIGWLEYYRNRQVWMYNKPYFEPEKSPGEELYLAAIAPQAHAPYITAACLWLNGSNDHHGGHERGEQTFKMFNPEVPWSFAHQARGHHNTEQLGNGCKLWLEKYVLGRDIFWPQRPFSEIKLNSEGVPELSITPDAPEKVQELKAWYALKSPVSFARAWRDARTVRQDDTWTAEMPVLNVDDYVFGFANIKYVGDIVISTDFEAAVPSGLGSAVATDQPSDIISEGTGVWTNVAPVEGEGGIKGFRVINNGQGTMNEQFSDPKWKAPQGARLSFDFYCTQPQTLIMTVNNSYDAQIEITASDDWQSMVIPAGRLINRHNSSQMKDWSDTVSIQLKPKPGMDITKVIFAEFKWVMPELKPVASWSFEENTPEETLDFAGNKRDIISGYTTLADGVSGQALKLDGFTSKVVRKSQGCNIPQLENGFTFEAWIAPQVYPWNWAAILNQEADHKAGWFFGMGGDGTIGLHIARDGKWIECNSTSRLPLLKWTHVAGSCDPASGLRVYINGKLDGELKTTGSITLAPDVDLWLGRSHTKAYPIRTERDFSKTFLSPMVFDGLIDEVKIYQRAVSDDEVAEAFKALEPKVAQPLKYRVMPSGPEGPGEFGAVYTRLNYAPEWERHWRVGDECDILVRFDESPSRIVFWRGMNYSASYVSENGLWAGDQSLEVNSHEKGCFEHMSDKRCERASAKIVENNDARVVVHSRYACVAIDGSFRETDPDTGWGIWADEYYTIYPDGVTVRHMVAVNHNGGGQWQETILFNQPGSRPEDTVEIEALTLANINGDSYTYSWENGPPVKYAPKLEDRMFSKPANANIQMVNFRSKWKPFIIFEPGTKILAFGIPPSTDYSNFACWNHWPLAQLPNDGRKTIVSDRPSSFTLSNAHVKIHRDENSAYLTMLYGMTDQPAANLAPLSKSWNSAPAAAFQGKSFEGGTFDKSQRAYVFTRKDVNAGELEFTLEANGDSPVHNPAFVVKNWGNRPAKLTVNGNKIPRGKDFRFGHHKTIDGTDLVVWVKTWGIQKTIFKLTSLE
jgi:dienelactone hydrolase